MVIQYSTKLKQLAKEKPGYGKLHHYDALLKRKNRKCGDKLELYIQKHCGKIVDLTYCGDACALCLASASLMTELVKGADIKAVDSLYDTLQNVLSGKEEDSPLSVFSHWSGKVMRKGCIELPWQTLFQLEEPW